MTSTKDEMSGQYQSLSVEVKGPVAEVTLRGPGYGNALGRAFWKELPEVFDGLDGDPAVRVVLLLGSESYFSVGLDLNDMPSSFGQLPAAETTLAMRWDFVDEVRRMQAAVNSIAECRKPVIAAVSGWCIGGGLDLISAADVRLASTDARFGLRETKLAIVADVGSLHRLRGIIGEGHLREIAFTGKDIDAEKAYQISLVNAVHGDRSTLLEAARGMALEIAANSSLTVQGVKVTLNEGREERIAEGLRRVSVWNAAFMPSDDLVEAFRAFREKRAPIFRHR